MLAFVAFAAIAHIVAASPVPQEASPVSSSAASSPQSTPATAPAYLQLLHPNGNESKCLDVAGANFNPGTNVQIYDCNGTEAQQFGIDRNVEGHIRISGTHKYCLDAGADAHDGSQVKIDLCKTDNPSQRWYYTDDNRIALAHGSGLCIDLTNESLDNGNVMQLWTCTDGNTNQIWTTASAPPTVRQP